MTESKEAKGALEVERQCSMYFEPAEFSPRYGRVFFTVVLDKHTTHADGYALYLLTVKCGTQSWTVQRRYSEFDDLLAGLRTVLTGPGLELPALPPKTWSRDLSPDFLSERTRALAAFLHGLLRLEQHRLAARLSAVRAFLELDRQLPPEEPEPEMEEEDGEEGDAEDGDGTGQEGKAA